MPIQLQGAGGVTAEVATYLNAQLVTNVPRGAAYSLSSITGTMAAALGANSSVFAMRASPTANTNVWITKFRMRWTTIVAFTTPITASRRLALYRGTGAAASGGTALAAAAKHLSTDPASWIDTAQGGDARIATTGALTVTGITFETQELRTMALTGFGAAGATVEDVYELDASSGQPFVLKAGELLAVRNPVAMDAAGTWQIDVDVSWYQA